MAQNRGKSYARHIFVNVHAFYVTDRYYMGSLDNRTTHDLSGSGRSSTTSECRVDADSLADEVMGFGV